jgi:hypothetical protein
MGRHLHPTAETMRFELAQISVAQFDWRMREDYVNTPPATTGQIEHPLFASPRSKNLSTQNLQNPRFVCKCVAYLLGFFPLAHGHDAKGFFANEGC